MRPRVEIVGTIARDELMFFVPSTCHKREFVIFLHQSL